MSGLQRQRWVRLGPVQFGISLPLAVDRQLARVVKAVLRAVRSTSQLPAAALPPDADEPLPARRPSPSDIDPEYRKLADQAARIDWYHTIELGHGVVTPGFVDHRDQLALYHLPDSLAGKRCLDVATFDGFWAFEMEKRGAAEVVAIDVARTSEIDLPFRVRQEIMRNGTDSFTGAGFRLAHTALGSSVKRKTISVYELSPELVGEFDFIFMSDILLHLRDPQLALQSVRSVCRGMLYLADIYHLGLETFGDVCVAEYPLWKPGEHVWWLPNLKTLKRMTWVAGFDTIEELGSLSLHVPGASVSSLRRGKAVLRATVGAQPRDASREAELAAV